MSFPLPFVRAWFSSPVISSIHDLYPYECPENFGYPQVLFNQAFLRQCIQSSDGLVCVSKTTLDALNYYFPKVKAQKKSIVIYNIVDFKGVESEEPQNSNCDFSLPFLVTVAQHRKNKNLDLLIEAYGLLRDEDRIHPSAWLLLVGSRGPETDELTNLIEKLSLENQVIFLSGLKDKELRWIYEQATLFIIPSSTEGFCLPLLEALSLACPVVCSNIPIFREVGTSYCQYFELDSQALPNLANAIERALSDPLTATGEADARFSREEISRQLLDFYELFLECWQEVPKKLNDKKPVYTE